MFLIPLIVIMLVQGMLTWGTLAVRQTFEMIQNYSISMMSRIVENRKVILENAMIQRCVAVCSQESELEGFLEEYLRNQGLTLEQMLASDDRKQEFLALVLPECLDNLQSSQSTGVFVILTGEDMSSPADYDGFFVRDSDPMVNTANNTDLLFERGRKELSREFNVPLDTLWTTYFHMEGQGQRPADDFFYEPWQAGTEHPRAETVNLGYWAKPFILEGNANDAHEMITYSVPLRYEGRVYGVMGLELASSFLYDYLPVSELNTYEQSGYLLALQEETGTNTVLLGKGILYNSITLDGKNFRLDETQFGTLYHVEQSQLGKQNIFAVCCPLKLYDNFAPYEDVNWALVGLNTEKELFGMSRQLYMWMGIALFLGLAFGVAGIYFIVLHLTSPIQNLVRCINGGSAGLQDFQPSNILEIDGLYDVIQDLTSRQKEAENILLEEKERYRVALESASDTFFTYDIQKNQLDIVNHPELTGTWDCGEKGLFNADMVYYEDRTAMENLLKYATDSVYVEFRFRLSAKEEFVWYALYGKVVNDLEGNRAKLVGGVRNIQEQKEQEEQQRSRLERDSVTGFYAYDAGMDKLRKRRARQPKGVMVYLFLDKLQELNEKNGIVFGDMVLEELGCVVRDCCYNLEQQDGIPTMAIRFDGDEFVIWLEGGQKRQAEVFVQEILGRLNALFDKEILRLYIYAGLAAASGDVGNMDLLRRGKLAQMQIKEGASEQYCFYDEVPPKKRKTLPQVQGGRPISNDYGQDVNLASLALNLFGKGANLPAQMTLLMRKIGYHYEATDVLATIIHPDFHSNYLEYQWHRDAEQSADNINQYTDSEWEEFQEWLGLAQVHSFTEADSRLPVLQKFLNISEGKHGVVLPMYDSGSYMGNMVIAGLDADLLQDAEALQKLTEMGSVIQSQLNQQQHDLASKAKSDFLSRMSHEIRTPMNGIIGMTAIALQRNQSKERMLDCLNKIQDSSNYLLGLINDILDMSKIESGKMHLEFVNFDLQEMLDTVGELMRPQIEAKQIDFVQERELTHNWFFADKMRISQVLINLLGNAVKFTGEKGKITLTVKETADEDDGLPKVYFAVQDSGIGISSEDQKRVFRSFEQARDTNSVSKQQGTGLGLSISSRLIQMMGSTITLESEVGKGSCFSFEIVLRPGQKEKDDGKSEEILSFKDFRVLIVEDNELNVEVAKCILEEYGFTADCVFDGAQAVERIKTTAPGTYDVVLMDIMMPVMNGLDATRAIRALDREDCRTLPIIAMSANAFDDDLKKSVECGMNGHLSKPVEVDKLYKLLAEILHKNTGDKKTK